MRLCIEASSNHEPVYIEVDHEEYAHLKQYADIKGSGPVMTRLVTLGYEYHVIVNLLDNMRKLPSGWDATRPEDATTRDRLFGIPLKVRE